MCPILELDQGVGGPLLPLLQPHMPVVSIRSGPSSRKSAAAAQEREERPTNALVEFQDRAHRSVFTQRGSLIRDESTTVDWGVAL